MSNPRAQTGTSRIAGDSNRSRTRAQALTDTPPLVLKAASFTLTVAHLGTTDLAVVQAELAAKVASAPGFFRDTPVVLDLQGVDDAHLDLSGLVKALRASGMLPVGIREASAKLLGAAHALGLAGLAGARPARDTAPAPAPQQPPAPAPAAVSPKGRIVHQPVRSGQQIYAGGDLILLAAVNPGAEVLAEGNIHVYAPLRGRALAGIKGDGEARIFTHCLEAELVSVAGVYRVIEDDLPPLVRGKPAQVYLDGEQLRIDPLS